MTNFPSPRAENSPLEELKEVAIAQIRVNPYQPRHHFSQVELEELAASIRTVGIIHPPTVRLCLSNSPEEICFYEIISGERRFRAAQMAGLSKIPVIVRYSDQHQSAQAALIENIQRVDLNPIEIAKALCDLVQQFHLNQDALAQQIGKKRSTVANYLRLLALPQNIQDSVSADSITMGHAKAILSLEGSDKQNLLHELILRDSLTVRESEEKALHLAEKFKKQPPVYISRDFYLEQLAEKIQHKLGTKVHIQAKTPKGNGKGKGGRITIDYYNLDDLDRLLSIFGISEL